MTVYDSIKFIDILKVNMVFDNKITTILNAKQLKMKNNLSKPDTKNNQFASEGNFFSNRSDIHM